jgi:type VI protein secretion system component Hcp
LVARHIVVIRNVVILALLWFGTLVPAVADTFLQLDGVFGPKRADKYSGWLPVSGFNLLGAVGKATPVLKILRPPDIASPVIAVRCADGTKSVSATLESTLTNTLGNGFFLQIRMTNAMLMVVAASSDSLASGIEERIQLGCAGLQWTYTQLQPRKPGRVTTPAVRAIGASSEVSGAMADAPPLQSTGSLVRPGILALRWNGIPGQTYRLMGATNLEGPFQFIRTLEPAATAGDRRLELPVSGAMQFFRVETE